MKGSDARSQGNGGGWRPVLVVEKPAQPVPQFCFFFFYVFHSGCDRRATGLRRFSHHANVWSICRRPLFPSVSQITDGDLCLSTPTSAQERELYLHDALVSGFHSVGCVGGGGWFSGFRSPAFNQGLNFNAKSRFHFPAAFFSLFFFSSSCKDFQLFSKCQPHAPSRVGPCDTVKCPTGSNLGVWGRGGVWLGQRVLLLLWSAFSPLIYYLRCHGEWMSRKGRCGGRSPRSPLSSSVAPRPPHPTPPLFNN